jgi:RNA polymerase sigma-70 factor (ECF subfamily)
VRAKNKIRDAKIPYEVPALAELHERLETVLHVIYLIFNEGYSASSGKSLTRSDLALEAIRLARLLLALLPQPDSEATGLLALLLLQQSRQAARTSADGELVLLADQNRSLWNRDQIAEGAALVRKAVAMGNVGSYTLQAAIAAIHAESPHSAATDWNEISGLYDLLKEVDPSPVVELNRAVAIAMRDGEEAGLGLIDRLLASGELDHYALAHAGRAELLRRLGRNDEARRSYERALQLIGQEPERRFIERRLRELAAPDGSRGS